MRAKRTHRGHRFSSVQDPGCVKTCMSRECAELVSPVSSVDGNWQSCPFPIQRNRDRISTRKIDVGMMKSWPETVIRWHRAGFRAYWRRKSRPRGGRPKTPLEIRHLVREMSLANPLWGRTTYPWRASQARHRCWANHRCKVYGEGKATAVPRVEDASSQSRRRHRVDGPVRGCDTLIPTALRVADTTTRSPPNPMAGSDCAPNG
jgi:hypothetical protein